MIYQKRGQFVEALKHYEKSMDLHKQINYEKGITKIYHNVGIIYRLQGDPTKALPYFEHSMKLGKKMGDLESISCTWRDKVAHFIFSMGGLPLFRSSPLYFIVPQNCEINIQLKYIFNIKSYGSALIFFTVPFTHASF